jgi:hypothetical protein
MLALAGGRLVEADELINDAYALGARAKPEGAIPVYRLQRYALNDFRGRLEDVEQDICDLVVEYPSRPVFRCAVARLHAVAGRGSQAAEMLGELAMDDFAALPFDQEWLFGMSFLAETAVAVDDKDAAAMLYQLIVPWAALNVVDQAEGIRGAASRYLGLLAVSMHRLTDAEGHFDDALAMNTKLGARPWLAQTQEDYAEMLAIRGAPGDSVRAEQLLGEARSTYRELGMTRYETRSAP